jgi:hypothetical protein
MIRLFRISFILLILSAVIGIGYWTLSEPPTIASQPKVLGATAREIPALDSLIVQVGDEGEKRRVLSCTAKGCKEQEPPKSVDGNALSDGTTWYRYEDRTQEGVTKRVLEKIVEGEDPQSITEENQFVRPRDMILSSDGTKIAYFLDNIQDGSGLTELWVYDSSTGGSSVLAEKLFKKDIASKVRWNASSRLLWFVSDGKKQEFVTVPLGTPSASARFDNIDWNQERNIADHGMMDVKNDSSAIAFATKAFPGFSQLVVATEQESVKKTLKGTIVFVRWMQDGELLYAVQDGDNLSFWMADHSKEWPIARMKATFRSAHSTGSSDLAAFIADPRPGEMHLYVLQLETGLVKDQLVIPQFPGHTFLVQANESATVRDAAVAGSTTVFSDATLAPFIASNIPEMAERPSAHALRIVTTDSPNTVYVDYEVAPDSVERILVTVQDVIYPSWKLLGRYTISGGQWKGVGGSQGTDPKPVRMYEWEDTVSQWILKQTY